MEIEQAFRYMQAGQHMGKIVIELSDTIAPTAQRHNPILFSSEHSYLLIGGLGGLGRAISQWMVENGARKLVYLSRSADATSSTRQSLFNELELQGCDVTIVAGDVRNLKDVEETVRKCDASIAGVIQLSMVLEVSSSIT